MGYSSPFGLQPPAHRPEGTGPAAGPERWHAYDAKGSSGTRLCKSKQIVKKCHVFIALPPSLAWLACGAIFNNAAT